MLILAVHTRTREAQQGFAPGRNVLGNVVRLDTAARHISGYEHVAANAPVCVAFDIAAALPSIGRDWFWAVLECIGLPCDCINFAAALHFGPRGLASLRGSQQILFYFRSGGDARSSAFRLRPGSGHGPYFNAPGRASNKSSAWGVLRRGGRARGRRRPCSI